MDTLASNILKECTNKEKSWHTRWNYLKPRPVKRDNRATSCPIRQSAASMYIEQMLGIAPSPYDTKQAPPQRLLYHGVSADGQGRAAYLKARRDESPQLKFGAPATSSHEVGWNAPMVVGSVAAFSKRPIVRDTFYRTNGVHNHD
eukprot:CAMPEP_0204341084 /NCGR_PEP_ID=MMETSP0469-20131031/23078_1 /ASSEMBLY_ACC=CAM_ASM_000384 /TAXON_ID=2969 /ORGANISM="Oxyrrhis marina" /LENGTH=144 /DNA_ID=CAMNT_0051325741 /DNA_START=10 /DNA_END=444 /DNA_ORIENTATION=-